MDAFFYRRVQCPYCGELIDMQVDGSCGGQAYVEDCSVCCRPIEVRLQADGDTWTLEVERDDD